MGLRTVLVEKVSLKEVGVFLLVLGEIHYVSDPLLPDHELAWSQIGQPAQLGVPDMLPGMGNVLECRLKDTAEVGVVRVMGAGYVFDSYRGRPRDRGRCCT